MKSHRDLIATNVAALLVLLTAVLVGWWEAAGFGLVVLVIMDLLVVVRERQARLDGDKEGDETEFDA